MAHRLFTIALLLAMGACSGEEAPRTAPFSMSTARSFDGFEGTVVKLVPAGGYLYAHVEAPAGSRWVASLKKPLAIGDRVHVRVFAQRDDFLSKRTGLRFEVLLFGLVTRT